MSLVKTKLAVRIFLQLVAAVLLLLTCHPGHAAELHGGHDHGPSHRVAHVTPPLTTGIGLDAQAADGCEAGGSLALTRQGGADAPVALPSAGPLATRPTSEPDRAAARGHTPPSSIALHLAVPLRI